MNELQKLWGNPKTHTLAAALLGGLSLAFPQYSALLQALSALFVGAAVQTPHVQQ